MAQEGNKLRRREHAMMLGQTIAELTPRNGRWYESLQVRLVIIDGNLRTPSSYSR